MTDDTISSLESIGRAHIDEDGNDWCEVTITISAPVPVESIYDWLDNNDALNDFFDQCGPALVTWRSAAEARNEWDS